MRPALTAGSVISTAFLVGAALFVPAADARAQRAPSTVPTRLSTDILAMACSPGIAFEEPPKPLRITGGQDSFARLSYSTSDLVTINAGSKNGIEVGQEYFVRRTLTEHRAPISRKTPASIRTTGWIKVYAVDDEMSLATVTHACETIDVGDYLEPLVHRAMPAPGPRTGKPERDNYGRVMTGVDFRRSFANGDFFILDRGVNFGITPGAQFVIYRDKKQADNFLYEIGEAVAVVVNAEWSTMRVTLARDEIHEGDHVSMRKPPAP
jgi:hypothetical protein